MRKCVKIKNFDETIKMLIKYEKIRNYLKHLNVLKNVFGKNMKK